MYEEGKGVDRDYAKALNWYHRAADQNHPEAQFKLGVIYANGLGVEQNVDRALTWLLAAARPTPNYLPVIPNNMSFSFLTNPAGSLSCPPSASKA